MNVDILVVPYDSAHRGERMGAGPRRLLDLGLADRMHMGGHQVNVVEIAPEPDTFLKEISTAFALARALQAAVADARRRAAFPLVLAGNCNTSLGTVAGLRAGREAKSVGVAWFDAHGDYNTPETTAGGFLDGMALSMLVGDCWHEMARTIPGFAPVPQSHVLMLGAHDFDPLEAERLERSQIRRLRTSAISQQLDGACQALASQVDVLYLHVDLDVLDVNEGRANTFALPGGMSAGTLLDAIKTLGGATRVRAAAITAYDPQADGDGRVGNIALNVAERLVGAAGG